jgi:hypothetical protein
MRRWLAACMVAACVLAVVAVVACSREPAAVETTRAPAAASPPESARAEAPPSRGETFRFPQPKRLVAIGDVHGDLDATRAALRLAGALGEGDVWTGGELVVVQVGDQLDRGDTERKIVELFDDLAVQAARVGGAVHALNGNHETMNVAGDFRYVTEGGFQEFRDVENALPGEVVRRIPEPMRGRAAAFFPGGTYAKRFAARRVIVVVGDTVFAHGGVLPAHVRYGIERINEETSAWMAGSRREPPAPVMDPEGPVWTRRYATEQGGADCAALEEALAALAVRRMVVGHTVQKQGVTSACGEKIWRVDVGLARYYGGPTEVLEIQDGRVGVLRERAAAAAE